MNDKNSSAEVDVLSGCYFTGTYADEIDLNSNKGSYNDNSNANKFEQTALISTP